MKPARKAAAAVEGPAAAGVADPAAVVAVAEAAAAVVADRVNGESHAGNFRRERPVGEATGRAG